jgi:hypothetical protein
MQALRSQQLSDQTTRLLLCAASAPALRLEAVGWQQACDGLCASRCGTVGTQEPVKPCSTAISTCLTSHAAVCVMRHACHHMTNCAQLLPNLRVQVRAVFEQLREPGWLVQDAAQPIEQIHQQVGSPVIHIESLQAAAASAPSSTAAGRDCTCRQAGVPPAPHASREHVECCCLP